MAYEIEFIGVGDEAKQDADAICMRWRTPADDEGDYKIAVYDAGFEAHGEAMVRHMNAYYFDDPDGKKEASEKVVDFMVVSHPHQDHADGAKAILENFNVKALVMNRPWLYADELIGAAKDKRMTKESLAAVLRDKYENIAELERLADEKGVPVLEAFQGAELKPGITICSPSKQTYLELLAESHEKLADNYTSKNPLMEFFKKAKNYVYSLAETWEKETLGEDASTDAENETSIVVRGIIDGSGFMLCGDAGVRALTETVEYLDSIGEDVKETVSFFEIPHHGSRHNVTPSLLNRLLGSKVPKEAKPKYTAVASVAKGSDHPLRVVTNAYKRRGAKVFKASGSTLHHHVGDMPKRNWGVASEIGFYDKVEEK